MVMHHSFSVGRYLHVLLTSTLNLFYNNTHTGVTCLLTYETNHTSRVGIWFKSDLFSVTGAII